MRVWVMLLVAACAAPSVVGQSLEPRLEAAATGPTTLLAPATGQFVYKLYVNVSCPLRPETLLASWTVSLKVLSTAPYAATVLNPSTFNVRFNATECTDPSYRVNRVAILYLYTSGAAPAFETFTTVIRAKVEQGGVSNATEVKINTTNDFVALIQLDPLSMFQKVRPGEAFEFGVDVKNLGNGPSRITINAYSSDERLERVSDPPEMILAPEERRRVNLTGNASSASGLVNYLAHLHASFHGDSPDPRGREGEKTVVTFAVQVATLRSSPAPTLLSLLAAAGLAIAMRGLRRAP